MPYSLEDQMREIQFSSLEAIDARNNTRLANRRHSIDREDLVPTGRRSTRYLAEETMYEGDMLREFHRTVF